jgi:predicted Holliday junction resolvase-like endonuclease
LLSAFFFKPAITAIEDKHQVELEMWTLEAAGEIRKDPVNRIPLNAEEKDRRTAGPVLPGFLFNPTVARFIGSPVDYIIFDGFTDVSNERQASIRVVFMDVKKGGGSLSRTQNVFKKAVEDKAVRWGNPANRR